MKVQFYYTNSDNRKVNKTIHKVGAEYQNVTIKELTTLFSPSIELNYNANLFQCNYLKLIEDGWFRYYFINDIQIGEGQTMIFNCSVDVLMSFKEDLLNSEQLITRQQDVDLWNKSMVDEVIPLKASRKKTVFTFNGSPFQKMSDGSTNIALTVTGGV